MKKTVVISFCLLSGISIFSQTPEKGTVTDAEGFVYRTLQMGRFEWMAENLKTTTCNDGTKIPCVGVSSDWTALKSSAFCRYDNNESKADSFGILYNWYAVNTGKLCPEGWRVPSDEEWKYLEGYVDAHYKAGDTIWNQFGLRGYDAGRRLKTTSGWYLGGNGTDLFGFSALPAGERLSRNGQFFIAGRNAFWWSSTGYNSTAAWYRSLIYAYDQVMRGFHDKRFGFSVRCLRDK